MRALVKFLCLVFESLRRFFPPLREVLSEDGYGSYSRVSGFLIVVFTLAWITYLLLRNHAMPDLTGPSEFVSTTVGTLYGINQVKAVVKAAKSGNPDPSPITVGAITTAPVSVTGGDNVS